jgi:hypothetical protein
LGIAVVTSQLKEPVWESMLSARHISTVDIYYISSVA